MKVNLMFKTLLTFCLVFSYSLFAETNILVFAGSTRNGSFNQSLARAAAEMAGKKGAHVTFINLKDYPIDIYNADLEKEQGMPENAKKIRQMMIDSQGIIIATPDYNGTVTPLLLNLLDWESRSLDGKPSREAYLGKKFAIMSASPGRKGGAKAVVALRAIIEEVGGTVIRSTLSVGGAETAFDAHGKLVSPQAIQQLNQEINELLNSIPK